ncbi:MAG TPA: hypothetical protein VF821_09400 [Lentzea sp.]
MRAQGFVKVDAGLVVPRQNARPADAISRRRVLMFIKHARYVWGFDSFVIKALDSVQEAVEEEPGA